MENKLNKLYEKILKETKFEVGDIVKFGNAKDRWKVYAVTNNCYQLVNDKGGKNSVKKIHDDELNKVESINKLDSLYEKVVKDKIMKEDWEKVLKEPKSKLKTPYVEGYVSELGGKDRSSLMITISTDDKKDF